MTTQAVESLRSESRRVVDLCDTLTPAEWEAASGCAGWRVQDVICHMACVFHSLADPSSIESGPPDDAEASAEVPVQARRSWSSTQVADDYRHWASIGLDVMAGMQEPPTCDMAVPLGNLGTHPLHLLANALVFDHYCHLRYDVGAAVARASEFDRDEHALRETRVWMLAGLPQMCAEPLKPAVTAPISLVFEGAGGGSWTIHPAGEDGLCQIADGSDGTSAATIISSVHDFVSWGTKRRDWRHSGVRVSGDETMAAAVLDAINVI